VASGVGWGDNNTIAAVDSPLGRAALSMSEADLDSAVFLMYNSQAQRNGVNCTGNESLLNRREELVQFLYMRSSFAKLLRRALSIPGYCSFDDVIF
jgi:hypothetical protein